PSEAVPEETQDSWNEVKVRVKKGEVLQSPGARASTHSRKLTSEGMAGGGQDTEEGPGPQHLGDQEANR
ncbi:hypothetical protein P7K49_005982, partial [Saguinus oedipus]